MIKALDPVKGYLFHPPVPSGRKQFDHAILQMRRKCIVQDRPPRPGGSFRLALDGSGDLYSATSGGGADHSGTVFELSPATTGAASAPEPRTLTIILPGFAGLGLAAAVRRKSSS